MLALRTVLCPVDFSHASARQAALAGSVCRAFGARLVLHHNVSAVAVGAGVGWMHAAENVPPSRQQILERLMELQAGVPPEVEVEMRVTQGSTSHAVLAERESTSADLVVLTTHGPTTDEHDSIAELVLREGRKGVLALHDPGVELRMPSFEEDQVTPQTFLVPTDLTPASRPAVALACEIARTVPIDIHLLHVVPAGKPVPEDLRAELGRLVPDDLLFRTSMHVASGGAAEHILRAAEDVAASCIIMGEHTRAPLRRWLSRDTSRAVLHRAACPIWYVP